MALDITGKNIKPWEHKISLGVAPLFPPDLDGAESTYQGIFARCTCGEYAQSFANGTEPADIVDRTLPHTESHPLPPLSTAKLGDSVAMVMAVPGPQGQPVHMTITVSQEVYDDGEKLAHHLSTIGSPLHFQIAGQHEQIRESMNSQGFHAIQLPRGVNGLNGVLDFLKTNGWVIDSVRKQSPDGSLQNIDIPGEGDQQGPAEIPDHLQFPTIGKKPEGWPGFRAGYGTFTTDRPILEPEPEPGVSFRFEQDDSTWRKPDLPLGDVSPRGDERAHDDLDDPDEYAP